ncbi:MAG: carboxy terminal-processing peptidase [Betaproteobacteria bacterium]|nr:carboxy terminal-processing peptidase [Betaproteobacteria bacterium]
MKQKLLWMIFALVTAAQGVALAAVAPDAAELKPERHEAQAAYLAAELLSRYHYKKTPLDSTLSATVFERYLKALDPEKLFFVQADIDRLAGERNRLGEAILTGDLAAPYAIYQLYRQRAGERFMHARALLATGFDFRQDESFQVARDKEAWLKTEAEVREQWRKRVKNDWLRLKLAGKDDKSIVDVLDKRYDNFLKRLSQVKSADVFQTFMNAYTTAIEPHTNYLGPRAAADFGIQMRLSLVGIGASLTELNEYTTIRELIPGGPASLSGQLQVGDRIVGVAQGEGGVMTDVMGWRLDDTVALIRGKEDTVVVLDVLPADAGPDGKHKLLSLVRKTINLAEQAAKATIHPVMDGAGAHRVGVISLPSFYADLTARQRGVKDYRSAARDVARLLDQMTREKVDSVLIDLRNNGGGSLSEAIELTGLFIDKGPVVQQRNARGEIVVESDTQAGVAWDGPLGVLINRNSASASEIFAAAIQDYGRGLVFGERSFGKGTVQSLISLDRFARSGQPQFGDLKLTVAQFFRINGGTTQLRGVTPDILMPAIADGEPFGEASFDNPLPATQVKPADYAPVGDLRVLLPMLLPLHEARVKNDKDYQYLQEDIAEIRVQRKKNQVTLNEAARRAEQDAREARLKSRESAKGGGNGVKVDGAGRVPAPGPESATRDDGLQAGERNLASLLAAEKARKDAKDVLLTEAVRILGDEVGLRKSDARLVARMLQAPALQRD